MRRRLALIGTTVLFFLGTWHVINGSQFYFDVIISLIGLYIFWKLYDTTNQDVLTLSFLITWLVLHNLGFYDRVILLVGWDRWMHLVGGLTLALIVDRWLTKEKWPVWQRAIFIVLIPLGAGAIHEIVEWVGFRELGHGQGFLFYGEGDFGEWRNSILDMASNLLGTVIVALYRIVHKR